MTDLKYDVNHILSGPREGFIVLRPPSSNLCSYALSALDLISRSSSSWNRHNFIFQWMDSKGRNLFYYYFKFLTDSFIFSSLSDVPPAIADLPIGELTRADLDTGPTHKGPALFEYVSPYCPKETDFSALRQSVDSLQFRFKFDRSSRGYYNDKFSRYNKIIGVDLRNVSESGLSNIFSQVDRLVCNSTSVRIFCSFHKPHLYDVLIERYGKRVYSRKKSDDGLRDVMMECGVLSKCDVILGSSQSDVFNLARVFSNLEALQ
jgi:hypothetical protein